MENKIPVGYCIAHVYGEVYLLLKYNILEINKENVLKEFASYDDLMNYIKGEKDSNGH